MYLHLGADTVVKTQNVIGIFDLENASTARSTRRYLADAQKRGRIVDISGELPKSFVITNEQGETKVYLSLISTATLKKRSGFIDDISNI